jgi:hypothetical protein
MLEGQLDGLGVSDVPLPAPVTIAVLPARESAIGVGVRRRQFTKGPGWRSPLGTRSGFILHLRSNDVAPRRGRKHITP